MSKQVDYTLYLVTDQFDFTEDEFLRIIEEALKGGVTILQLREKDSTTKDFYELAVKVKEITDKYDVPLIINDRIDIALAVDAAGVHLGQDDMPCKIARQILGPDKIIGISAEKYIYAITAQNDGADYLGVGAIRPTPTKTDCMKIPEEDLQKVQQNITIPHVAIGGVKLDNTKQVMEDYNFSGVSVVSAIMLAEDPQQAARNFIEIIKDN
ncbi:thiamine phosphate synthase [uncultured Methanosphaera sp.]|uniref:thiamine phosphate synthase n=1 Tax=uncultured Methanosphaera sp. TaxID=262501 RepID=UPI002805D6E9|nr:thiamine phosphate synthase [uncultured Methanosphaera sp.]